MSCDQRRGRIGQGTSGTILIQLSLDRHQLGLDPWVFHHDHIPIFIQLLLSASKTCSKSGLFASQILHLMFGRRGRARRRLAKFSTTFIQLSHFGIHVDHQGSGFVLLLLVEFLHDTQKDADFPSRTTDVGLNLQFFLLKRLDDQIRFFDDLFRSTTCLDMEKGLLSLRQLLFNALAHGHIGGIESLHLVPFLLQTFPIFLEESLRRMGSCFVGLIGFHFHRQGKGVWQTSELWRRRRRGGDVLFLLHFTLRLCFRVFSRWRRCTWNSSGLWLYGYGDEGADCGGQCG